MVFFDLGYVGIAISHKDSTHRITEFIPTGASQSCNGNRNVSAKQFPNTHRHFSSSLWGNSTKVRQSVISDTQNIMFYFIGVADDTALVDSGTAGNRSQRRTDSAAGQTFSSHQGFSLQPL